jgi:hypothetical protein
MLYHKMIRCLLRYLGPSPGLLYLASSDDDSHFSGYFNRLSPPALPPRDRIIAYYIPHIFRIDLPQCVESPCDTKSYPPHRTWISLRPIHQCPQKECGSARSSRHLIVSKESKLMMKMGRGTNHKTLSLSSSKHVRNFLLRE